MQAHEKQYTIRGVPRELDAKLRQRATARGQSLNQLILDELREAVSARRRYSDLSDIVGSWDPDPAFDEVIASQRQIDMDKWR